VPIGKASPRKAVCGKSFWHSGKRRRQARSRAFSAKGGLRPGRLRRVMRAQRSTTVFGFNEVSPVYGAPPGAPGRPVNGPDMSLLLRQR